MGLSCSCDFDTSDFDWWWIDNSNFQPFKAKRRKRCCSCKQLIDLGADSVEFYKYRHANGEIEERIYGDEVPIASDHMCEECGGLFFALDELGYGCIDISNSMKGYIDEYNEIYRP